MSTTTTNITEQEREALEQFKQKISQDNVVVRDNDDEACLRWLRARKFDVNKSYEMVTKYVEWREKKQIDKLSLEKLGESLKTKAVSFMGTDKDGRIAVVVFPARHTPGTLDCGELENLLSFTIDAAVTTLTRNDKFILLFDYEGWGLSCVDSNVDKVIMNVGQNNYPERLGDAFLIRPPWYFSTVWNIVKYFLDEKTKSKFTFVYKNEELLNRFDTDNLLERYGGTRKEQTLEEFLVSVVKDETITLGDFLDNVAKKA